MARYLSIVQNIYCMCMYFPEISFIANCYMYTPLGVGLYRSFSHSIYQFEDLAVYDFGKRFYTLLKIRQVRSMTV